MKKKKIVKKTTVLVNADHRKQRGRTAPNKAIGESPLNSKEALADLRKLYRELDKTNAKKAELLAKIAKQESQIGEVLDLNLAKVTEDITLGVPPAGPAVSVSTTAMSVLPKTWGAFRS